ncbi:unnamed protein product [Pleuronectes platessa]|uniref:Uncharacterized protein n=1 Tax=Pleuronectes platessa TaxID=8262 RepID=A0A9N7YKG9_PLEPL|nr:unnamed protein product [Pleuronectes platessa]
MDRLSDSTGSQLAPVLRDVHSSVSSRSPLSMYSRWCGTPSGLEHANQSCWKHKQAAAQAGSERLDGLQSSPSLFPSLSPSSEPRAIGLWLQDGALMRIFGAGVRADFQRVCSPEDCEWDFHTADCSADVIMGDIR